MRLLLPPVLGFAMLASAGAHPAAAQDAAYIVSYVEVVPPATGRAVGFLRDFAKASRKEDGSARFEVLQRIDRPHHFAVLEVWKDQKAQEAHAAAEHTKQFRAGLEPMLAVPYDERPHTGLAVMPAGGTKAGKGAVYAVTHVDFIPPKKDDGIAALKTLVEPSRKETGNLRFDVLQQASRPNHETVVEIWKDRKVLEAHIMAPHTKAYRAQTLPMSGSLYDERLYHTVD